MTGSTRNADFISLLLLRRKRGVVDRIARLPGQIRKERRAPRILEPRLARQPGRRPALVEDVVVARLALPVLNAVAGCLEFLCPPERVDRAHRLDERVTIVEGDLYLEPFDIVGIALQL